MKVLTTPRSYGKTDPAVFEMLEKAGLEVQVLRMQGAKDPDEFIKTYGRDAFAALLDRSKNHVDYRLEQLAQTYNLQDDAQKVEFLREAADLVSALQSPVEREVYGGHAAQMAGISPEAVALEVRQRLRRRIFKEKKQEERRSLAPAAQLQPQARELRYENFRSARAEEGVIRLSIRDPALLEQMDALKPEEFSSALLGKVFGLLQSREAQGLSVSLGALAGDLDSREMDHMTQVVSQPESAANSAQALRDYIAVIRDEGLRRRAGSEEELLRAAQKRYQEKKAYMEEKP